MPVHVSSAAYGVSSVLLFGWLVFVVVLGIGLYASVQKGRR
jgi:hypothetical protein